MSTIHMDTEYTLQQARFLERQSNELINHAEMMQRVSNKLSSSWSDVSSSSNYQSELNGWIDQFKTKAQELQVLSNRISLEVDEWLTMDSQGQAKTHQIRENPIFQRFLPIVNFFKGIHIVISIPEVREYLLNTPNGEELERLAIENGLKFVFEDGSFIGDPNGKEILIHFGETENYDGFYNIINKKEIVVNDDNIWTAKEMAAMLGHEMQHAIDDTEGKYFIPDMAGITDKSQIEVLSGQQWDSYIDSEVRAYARQASINSGIPYQDDGVTSPAERAAFFRDYPIYEHDYEAVLNKAYPEYTADVRLNSAGEVEVVLTPVTGLGPYKLE